jgi:hypothetical protein
MSNFVQYIGTTPGFSQPVTAGGVEEVLPPVQSGEILSVAPATAAALTTTYAANWVTAPSLPQGVMIPRSTFVVLPGSGVHTVLANTYTGAFTVWLPDATLVPSDPVMIKNVGTNVLTIAPLIASQYCESYNMIELRHMFIGYEVVSDGRGAWWVRSVGGSGIPPAQWPGGDPLPA